MTAPLVVVLIVTVWADVNVPGGGERLGVNAEPSEIQYVPAAVALSAHPARNPTAFSVAEWAIVTDAPESTTGSEMVGTPPSVR